MWTAIVLTCPNQNSSFAYQKELRLRQEKGFISKDTLLLSIEDPESPIGSGGATLNAIHIVAEALSARNKFKMTQIEILKNEYILIMHMGRGYAFDVIGKAFATLPFQDKHLNLLTNFDILYNMLTDQIAGLNSTKPHSDSGVYVCSTDMIFMMPKTERVCIRNSSICVISTLADKKVSQKNGIFVLDEKKEFIENIYFKPNDEIISKDRNEECMHNLISGVVYFNYEVVQKLYSLILYAPIEGCTYIGIDNGASSLSLSLFLDILLSACNGIDKEDFLEGSFNTNHIANPHQQIILRQARSILWKTFHSSTPIKNITVKNSKYLYLTNDSFDHRLKIFRKDFLELKDLQIDFNLAHQHIWKLNSNISCYNKETSSVRFVNTILTNANLQIDDNVNILNCRFENCDINIGKNCHLTDLDMNIKSPSIIPANLFIQNVNVNIECLNTTVNLNVVFGITDHLPAVFNKTNWKIMNRNWKEFSEETSIVESDLWSSNIKSDARSLMNAQLYTVVNTHMDSEKMNLINESFWIEIFNCKRKKDLANKWRISMRLSLEDILLAQNQTKLFENRRSILNRINAERLVSHVIESRSLPFISLIRNAVYDGYANDILQKLDQVALENSKNLVLLPRLMSYISIVLSEMALEFNTLRSGPSLNSNWIVPFELIELEKNKEALLKMTELRQVWMNRNDLLIRASRHYEGAMLAFIRQATSCFKKSTADKNPIQLESIDKKREFEWVEARCPARLDLAGAWSDTPPITYECNGGGSVTNVAILVNNEKPIGAKGRILKSSTEKGSFFIKVIMKESSESKNETSFEFTEKSEFHDYNKPRATACLMKAVFIHTRLVVLNDKSNLSDQLTEKVNGTLELQTWTGLPQGSGLGTSSILICCVLKVIWYLMGIKVSDETLAYSTLIVEQLMTTNGGWQDQVGGIYGGFKFTTARNILPLEIRTESINLTYESLQNINDRLLLVYTGLTRLAKDLLLNVLRNWYTISTRIYDNVQGLIENEKNCRLALKAGNLTNLGDCINNFRRQKLVMAPGSEPDTVKKLISVLEPFVYGSAMAGAGGGGFLYALTKEPNCKSKIQKFLDSADLSYMKIYEAQVSNSGIELYFN